MPKFKVGDRVIALQDHEGRELIGKTGTILSIAPRVEENAIGVEWEDFSDGHNLSGLCKPGCGWWIHAYKLELYPISLENK